MAEAKWAGVLSTTEPRNDVGIIKVRQGNINSEIVEFQIVQNNKPYDLTGLTVYFCVSFGLNLVEKPAVVVNNTGGRIQYTFDDDSMQSVGRQKGYFSIKKAESKIDSTQDFEFQVDSSLMTRSIDGKSYIYKLSTLIKVLDDFVKNGQSNFNTWFESVKEILYGVDPGGNVLRELIEARNNQFGKIFSSLKTRLDDADYQDNLKSNDLLQRGVNVENFPRLIHENSDSGRIQRAIDSIKSDEFTEAVPESGAQGFVYIPAGKYEITEKINVPSYIFIKGAGRHATIFDSYITNGDPVFNVRHSENLQQFYVTLESFTVNGRYQNCQGVLIHKTSRWIIRDVMVDGTLREGINLYSAFLGEIYSPLVRACGSAGYYAFKLSGVSSISGGSHAVSVYGGEINGGTGTEHGVFMEYGNSSGFFGTTIEGFRQGRGVTVRNANAFFLHGVYFELNKEDIVEIGPTLGSTYRDNIYADLAPGSRGVIGITNAQGLTLSGGYMQGGADVVKIFDATADGSGKLLMSNIEPLYATSFPIKISPSIMESAKRGGTIIETYNANNQSRRYGNQQFNDELEVLGDLKPTGGIKSISGFSRTDLTAGSGSPEGKIIGDVGSLYTRIDGLADTTFYIKKSGENSMYGWVPLQPVLSGTSANRPSVSTIGYCFYDASLGKPIWWNGLAWKDSTGTTV